MEDWKGWMISAVNSSSDNNQNFNNKYNTFFRFIAILKIVKRKQYFKNIFSYFYSRPITKIVHGQSIP